MDKDKRRSRSSEEVQPPSRAEVEELYRHLRPELRGKPRPEEIAAAMDAAQRLSAEMDAEDTVSDFGHNSTSDAGSGVCPACGYHNRSGNRFCGMCGATVESGSSGSVFPGGSTGGSPGGSPGEERRPRPIALHPNPFLDPEPEPEPRREHHPVVNRPAASGNVAETHHYHHHYHYFNGGQDGAMPRDAGRGDSRDERSRPSTAALRGDMSRAEAAVRRLTQEWAVACNTKHLDDLLELYVADAIVLRSNYTPVRGGAAVREFFFGALDAGLGEVELEPIRVEVVGDMAYEAGRCKALVPSTAGKRREERAKYLWVCLRQPNGEWKLAVDSWSSDLALTSLESDAPPSGTVRSSQPRKG